MSFSFPKKSAAEVESRRGAPRDGAPPQKKQKKQMGIQKRFDLS